MHRIKGRVPSPAMVVALIALIAATGGTATALQGTKTVLKDDLATNSVTASAIAKNAVSRSEIKANGVSSGEIKDGAVKGGEVDESSLGQVPSALTADQLGGVPAASYLQTSADTIGRSGFDSVCDPTSATFVDCATTSITLARTGRLLVVGEAPFGTDTGPGTGNCRIELDGAAVANAAGKIGMVPTSAQGDSANVGYGITTVTAAAAAGAHTVSISCNETGGDTDHNDSTISVVALGAG